MKDMFMWLQHLVILEVQSLMDFQDLVKKKSKVSTKKNPLPYDFDIFLSIGKDWQFL